MNINWRVRVKNAAFWLAIVPAILLLVQAVAKVFGYELDFTVLNERLADVINAVFGILVLIGIVADPTTPGINDSDRAMQYTEPGKYVPPKH